MVEEGGGDSKVRNGRPTLVGRDEAVLEELTSN